MSNTFRQMSAGLFIAIMCLASGGLAADDFLDKFKSATDQLQQLEGKLPQAQRTSPSAPQQPQASPSQPQTSPAQPVSQSASAQATPVSDCCTPEATAKIAASAGYIDVVGIKLGTEGKQAMELMKAANPALKIDLQKVEFNWECATTRVCNTTGQKKQWASVVKGEVPYTEAKGGETIEAHLTLPPNQQVVYYLSRSVVFPKNATPTVDNVLAGLRKKYGPPTYDRIAGNPPLIKWLFDSQGQLLDAGQATKLLLPACEPGTATPNLDPPASGYRGKTPVSAGQCEKAGVTVIKASVNSTTTGGNMAGVVIVNMVNVPLLYNGANATNAALDHLLKQHDEKKLQEAEKVGAPKF